MKLAEGWIRRVCIRGAPLVVLLIASGVGVGGYHRTRARCRCGIPCQYAYGSVRPTGPATAISATAVLLPGDATPASPSPTPATAAVGVVVGNSPTPLPISPGTFVNQGSSKIKFYQFIQSRLPLEHCSISRVAMVLQETGHWRLSLQADQNPKQPNGVPKTAPPVASTTALPAAPTTAPPVAPRIPPLGALNPPQKQTAQIRRSQFFVVVRGYAANSLKDQPDNTTIGKPLLFRFEMEPFWVENGVPRDMVWDGDSSDVKAFFGVVDRIEVSFSFR